MKPLLYNFRVKLSHFLIRLGKNIHPDIATLHKEILRQQENIGESMLRIYTEFEAELDSKK